MMTPPQSTTILSPTAADLARDLSADLAVCNAATPGPWVERLDLEPPDPGIESAGGGCVCHVQCHSNLNTVLRTGEEFRHTDARFIAIARTALPALIRRCHAAEQRVRELERELSQLNVAISQQPLSVQNDIGAALEYLTRLGGGK